MATITLNRINIFDEEITIVHELLEVVQIKSNIFSGDDSYGKKIEVAKNSQNQWFTRRYEYNGYGMGYSKWTLDEHFAAEVWEDGDKNEVLKYGWNELKGYNAKLRLPKY